MKNRIVLLIVVALIVLAFGVALLFQQLRESQAQYPSRLLPAPKADVESSTPSKECRAAYDRLFADDTLNVRVIFGYKDTRPTRFVGDRYESLVFTRYLTAPCVGSWQACGFKRDAEDVDLFRKTIRLADGKSKEVILRVAHSSVSPDDAENRKDPFQKWKSLHASRAFLDGIEKADVVFYNGHSRDGGGPDFAPPLLTPGDHVNYPAYVDKRPGLKKLIARLSEKEARVKMLGMFSCASTAHFQEQILKAKPGIALISSSRLLYYMDAMQAQLGALSSILRQECETGFGHALRAHPEAGNSRLTGFFRN